MSNYDVNILVISRGNLSNKSHATSLNKLIKILSGIYTNIFLLTCSDIHLITNLDNRRVITLSDMDDTITNSIVMQISVLYLIIKLFIKYKINSIIFAFGQDLQFMPIIVGKLIGANVILRSDGRPSLVLENYKGYSPYKIQLFRIIESINYRLVDTLLTESVYMISKNKFEDFSPYDGRLFVDTGCFNKKIGLYDRPFDIGFIGRLEKEKGIIELLGALNLVKTNLNVLIIGDGSEKNRVLSLINNLSLKRNLNIKYLGWINNKDLPDYLNQIKLLILPSYKEGLPNILLEAMACGCITLSVPVGGIPGIVEDNINGFILKNNSPDCIAEHLLACLKNRNLNVISDEARASIEREFTYDTVIERWKLALLK